MSATMLALALVAACSSSPKSSSGSTAAAPAGGGSAPVVKTRSGQLGTYLTDASGRSLYMFAADTSAKSTCTGQCTAFWPPLITGSSATAGDGATNGLLSTITRSDGSRQIAYAGHPLYYFKQDSTAGDINGEGSNGFGAKWWLLDPSGQPITGAASSSSSSSSSGGGGYGY